MGAPVPPAAPVADDTFEVMTVNWQSLLAFLACETQWRVALGMAGAVWLGLDYAGVDVVLRHRSLNDPDRVFADLQIMESAALAVLAEAD